MLTSHLCFQRWYSHRIVLVLVPPQYILCPCFLCFHIHYYYSYFSPSHLVHQSTVAGRSLSFLLCYTYLPSLNFLHLDVPFNLIASSDWYVNLGPYHVPFHDGLYNKIDNQSNVWMTLLLNPIPTISFSSGISITLLVIPCLIFTTNPPAFLPNTLSYILLLFAHFHIHAFNVC